MTVLDLNTKTCMQHLLLTQVFHRFLFIEGEVTTFNRFLIDGRLHKDFFDENSDENTDEKPNGEYSRWKDVQSFFLSIIRGKRTPLNFKIILSLPPEELSGFLSARELSFRPEDIGGLYLNLRYDGSRLQCVTGTSVKTFTLDKELEQEWDKYAQKLLADM